MNIRAAKQKEHAAIMAIAKQTPHTRDFGHMMFSGEQAYKNGWIRVGETRAEGIVGFTCVRHKVKTPETSLYFIAVEAEYCGTGIGTELLEDLKQQSPHKRIVLNVMKDNTSARAFYKKHGFVELGDSLKGKGVQLALEWK